MALLKGPIRFVTFDALHTVVRIRHSIAHQYRKALEPYVGELDGDAVRRSFKTAFLEAKKSTSSSSDPTAYWSKIITATALGAGANPEALNSNIRNVVDDLMLRFSSRAAYEPFSDAKTTLDDLETAGIPTAIISNADSRMRLAMEDLGLLKHTRGLLISDEEGFAKPDPRIFHRAMRLYGPAHIEPEQCLHIGDDPDEDYRGALAAGFQALHLRRPDGQAVYDNQADLSHTTSIEGLHDVARLVREANGDAQAE
ncbi:hypothetical protein PLICRDRAFT_36861 [Plicaturopsis crispa FD-325 SS-3]|nr:hypothetical protein PLICRDRAFT_36861 [Plicaturopsis crispa FD-325 SS-3]